MDTDYLSNETYKGVIMEAENLSHDLTLNFAVLANHCENEAVYLQEAKELAEEIKDYDTFELEDLLFGNVPEKGKLFTTLNKIIQNIEEISKISPVNRHYEF